VEFAADKHKCIRQARTENQIELEIFVLRHKGIKAGNHCFSPIMDASILILDLNHAST
jgi:hypothetical protein